ncbi:hypothetical protein HBE96_23250 [Clostridium sp. P21]|uniref:Uncharacterized protein n=1 Tax=Clostridium muellerianum TaxID=2716538 RepID=A0A7Y0EL63_9CLOT|nr:hypothetical protein [Clostridium muellerianum]
MAKVHLNYSKTEFLESSFREIVDMWKAHVKFNGWEVKNDDEGNNTNQGDTYKHVNIEDISFL